MRQFNVECSSLIESVTASFKATQFNSPPRYLSAMKSLRPLLLSFALGASVPALASSSSVFEANFDGDAKTIPFTLLYGASIEANDGRANSAYLKCAQGGSTLISKQPLNEMGVLELWVKPTAPDTHYEMTFYVRAKDKDENSWVKIGAIESEKNDADYTAKRVSIDEAGSNYLKIEINVSSGSIAIDDIAIDKIGLAVALRKSQLETQKSLQEQFSKNEDAKILTESIVRLGEAYISQIELQRRYLESSAGITATLQLALATSQRNQMANPLAYQTFGGIVKDVKSLSSPIQSQRVDSLLKPFGDIATATLNVVSGGVYPIFAETFKSIVAASFERNNYANLDIPKDLRKYAEKNGPQVYTKTETFLNEIKNDLGNITALDKDLSAIQKEVDSFRKDLEKNLREYLAAGGMEKNNDSLNRIMSKDPKDREAAIKVVRDYFASQAAFFQNGTKNNAQLLQFLLVSNSKIEKVQEFDERFNQITSSVLTFYSKFEKSIEPEKNPFSTDADKKTWENSAKSAREHVKKSRAAFESAYINYVTGQ